MDSLFTLQLEENTSGNKLVEDLRKYFEEFPDIELDSQFSYNTKIDFGGERTVADLLKSYVGKVEAAIALERENVDKTPGKLKALDALYTSLLDTVTVSYKNVYVKTLIDTVRANKNLEDGVTPIGFTRFKGIVTDTEKPPSAFQLLTYLSGKSETEHASKEEVDNFINSSDNFFSPATQQKLYESTARGAQLTGIFANASKAVAMILYKWAQVPLKTLSIELDSHNYNTIRRTENDKGARNIFHTIDTLINAAIDNVKEEILLHIDISAKNSNQFIAAIALGIPLNDVITIFTHPVIRDLGKKRTYELSKKLDIDGIAEKVSLSAFKDRKGLSIAALKDSIRNKKDLPIEQLEALLGAYYTLTEIGDALFDATMSLSILNKLPGTSQEMTRLVSSWSKIVSFKGPELEVTGLSRRAAGMYSLAMAGVARANSIARKGSSELALSPVESWPFEGVTLYDIRHIRSLLASTLSMQSLLESMIWQDRKEFDYMAVSILDEAGGWPHSAAEDKELIRNHFWRYLTSNMTIKIGPNNVISTRIEAPEDPEELRFTTKSGVFYRSAASKWMQEFEDRVRALKGSHESHNPLLHNIQYNPVQGLTLVNMSDPINLANAQTGFLALRELTVDDPRRRYSQFQVDLFKYVILKDGLSFDKVSLSPVFPVEFYVGYSRAMEARMASVLGHGYSVVGFAKIETLRDAFKYQLLRNRVLALKWTSHTKKVSKYPAIDRTFARVYKGNHPDYFRDKDLIFKKVDTVEDETGVYSYFAEIPSTSTPYYEFEYDVFEDGFDFDKAIGGDLDSRKLFYVDYHGASHFKSDIDLEIGSIVRIMEKKAARPHEQSIAIVTSRTPAPDSKKRWIYRFDVIGEQSLGNPAQVQTLKSVLDQYSTRSSVSMSTNALVDASSKRSFIVMAVGSSDPSKGLEVDKMLYDKIGEAAFNIKPLVLYDVPTNVAIDNIDKFFEDIKDDSRVLAFDRDKLYKLTAKDPLDINITDYILTKLREERGYGDSTIDTVEVVESLPDTTECK